jgi:hypothetical protein
MFVPLPAREFSPAVREVPQVKGRHIEVAQEIIPIAVEMNPLF